MPCGFVVKHLCLKVFVVFHSKKITCFVHHTTFTYNLVFFEVTLQIFSFKLIPSQCFNRNIIYTSQNLSFISSIFYSNNLGLIALESRTHLAIIKIFSFLSKLIHKFYFFVCQKFFLCPL